MSNPDSFIDEVNEELKRDRLFALMRKWGWVAVLGGVVLVGGAAVNEWRKAQAESRARAFGDAVIGALEPEDLAARRAALAVIDADGARAGILNLLLAATELEAQNRPAALAVLASVAADASLPASYRQIAQLKRVILGGTDLPLAERETALQALAAPGQTFRALALEQLALLALERGDSAGALAQAQALLQEPEITDTLRRRVLQVIVVLGGEPPAVDRG